MPAKQVKSKTVKSIDKVYSALKKEIEKDKREKSVAKFKIPKKQLDKIKQEEQLEKDRQSFVKKIYKVFVEDINDSDKTFKIKEVLERYHNDTQDDDFKILIETFLENIELLEVAVKHYLSKLKKESKIKGGNTLTFFKNELIDIAPVGIEEKYVENVGKALEGVNRQLIEDKRQSLKKSRDQFLEKLGFAFIDGKKSYKKIIDEYRSYDKSMADLVEKFDIADLATTISKYNEYKVVDKDLDPIEFVNNEYNNINGIVDQPPKDVNLDYYKNMLEKIENDVEEASREEQEDEEEEGEMPEVYAKKRQPVKDIKVIIPPEMKEKIESLYKYTKKQQKPQSAIVRSAVILGVDKSCLELQLYKPWIYKYSSTWISTPVEEVLEKYSYSEDIISPIVIDGIKYYHANRLFHILQCNSYSKNRSQYEDILKLYEDEKTSVEFNVAHLLSNDKVLKQTEKLFKEEVEYMEKRKLLSDSEKILNAKLVENFRVVEIAKRISKNKIKRHIIKVAEKHKIEVDEQKIEKYSDAIVESIYNKNNRMNVRDFMADISDILIYLDNRMIGDYANNFQIKLVNMFYRADAVKDIRTENRFEELYKNPKYTKELKNKLSQRMQFYRGIIVEELSRQIVYELAGRPSTQRDYEKMVDKLDLDILDIKSQCKNKDVLDDSLGEYLVYTEKSTGDTYCISLYNIGDRNPYTEKPYPRTVLKELENLDKNMITSYFNKTLFGDEDDQELAPNLIQFLVKNIKDMEDKLGDNPDEKSRAGDLKQVCEYCQEHIKGDKLKTVVKYGPNSKIVGFCRMKCFEDWDVKKSK